MQVSFLAPDEDRVPQAGEVADPLLDGERGERPGGGTATLDGPFDLDVVGGIAAGAYRVRSCRPTGGREAFSGSERSGSSGLVGQPTS